MTADAFGDINRKQEYSTLSRIRKKYYAFFLTILIITSSLSFVSLNIRADSADPWFDPGWAFRKKITIDHTEVDDFLNNFPVLLDILDSDLTIKCQSNGNDISFTTKQGQKINHEIEFYDNSNGHLIVWVQIPFLSSITDTEIYMYYGNFTASNQENPIDVWDTSYKAVYHLPETSGQYYDSTSNNNDGYPVNVNQNYPGQIAGSAFFDGTSYIEISNSFDLNWQQVTLEAWIYPTDVTPRQFIISKFKDGMDKDYSLGLLNGHVYIWYETDDNDYTSSIGTVSNNQWYHIAVVYTNWDAYNVYINGILAGSDTNTGPRAQTDDDVEIGHAGGGYNSDNFNGIIDEVRISNSIREASWIQTSYNNQLNPSNFYFIDAEEYLPDAPLIFLEEPKNGAEYISGSLSQLNFSLLSPQGYAMNYSVTTSPHVGSTIANNVPSGRYSVSVSDLEYSTTYLWTVNATDGGNQTIREFTFTTEPDQPIIEYAYPTIETNYNPQ